MKDVTGKDIVTNMMRLATEMSSWNKAYATEDKAAKRMEELGLTRHQLDVIGFLYTNPELDTYQLYRRICTSAREVYP